MNKYFKRWYRPESEYHLESEEYWFIAYLITSCAIAFGLGLLLGLLWVVFI